MDFKEICKHIEETFIDNNIKKLDSTKLYGTYGLSCHYEIETHDSDCLKVSLYNHGHICIVNHTNEVEVEVEMNEEGADEIIGWINKWIDWDSALLNYAEQEPPKPNKFTDGFYQDHNGNYWHGNIKSIEEVQPVVMLNSLIQLVEGNFNLLEHDNDIAFLVRFDGASATRLVVVKDDGYWPVVNYMSNGFIIADNDIKLYKADQELIEGVIRQYINGDTNG